MAKVTLTVNGKTVSKSVEGRTLLSSLLRDDLHLTGTHVGCDTSQCGACVVHVNGEAVKSCTMFAAEAEGAEVGNLCRCTGYHNIVKAIMAASGQDVPAVAAE